MARPKILLALDTLTKEEWSLFRRHILLYTREDSDNFRCFSLLAERKNKLSEEGLADRIREKYFPSMSPKAFSNILSRLFGWFEDWFAIHTFKNQQYAKALSLVQGYNQRGLFKLADQHFIKLEKRLETQSSLSLSENRARAELYKLMYYSNNPIKSNPKVKLFEKCISSHLLFTAEQSSLRLLELKNKSMYWDRDFGKFEEDLISYSKISVSSYCHDIIKETIDLVENINLQGIIKIANELEHGTIAKSSDLYLILTTMTTRMLNNLWSNNKLKDVDIYIKCTQLQFDALLHHKHFKIHPVHFFNEVTSIAEFASYEATELFINEWIPKLHTKHPSSAFKYCQAINEFRHDNFNEVPRLLIGLQFDELVHKLVSNCMLIVSYFELQEHDLLHTLIHNFKKQLKRNTSTNSTLLVEGMQNLIRVILKLEEARTTENIHVDINEYSPVFFRSWVRKKTNI